MKSSSYKPFAVLTGWNIQTVLYKNPFSFITLNNKSLDEYQVRTEMLRIEDVNLEKVGYESNAKTQAGEPIQVLCDNTKTTLNELLHAGGNRFLTELDNTDR
ncbi:hypothetical protein ElyMa_003811100 [Elysia marginata]|uniref:Uncharacterized protein n=1 Tax=Elysia marginata TaxID=1093978 RepID=A0AAV4FG84_9GAST|nr:hypothetical protein ElyMa_003811100 [Elysia marginata]